MCLLIAVIVNLLSLQETVEIAHDRNIPNLQYHAYSGKISFIHIVYREFSQNDFKMRI